jgi:hypothetical protein
MVGDRISMLASGAGTGAEMDFHDIDNVRTSFGDAVLRDFDNDGYGDAEADTVHAIRRNQSTTMRAMAIPGGGSAPRTTTVYADRTLGWPYRILNTSLRVVVKPIMTPFPDIAVHVEQTACIGT